MVIMAMPVHLRLSAVTPFGRLRVADSFSSCLHALRRRKTLIKASPNDMKAMARPIALVVTE